MGQFILAKMGGGKGFTLDDADMWGMQNALIHGIQNGYFKDNQEWAAKMLYRITSLRDHDAMPAEPV